MGLAGWVIGGLNWPIGLGWNGTDLGLGRTRLDNVSQVTHLLLLHKQPTINCYKLYPMI